jgi:hypothetical protein
MASATPPEKFIDWRKSYAKLIIVSDLEKGILPADENDFSPEDLWECCYKHVEAFQLVPFRQFQARLNDHRQQHILRVEKAQEEEIALVHDRELHPQQTHNRRGELVFNMTPAKAKLREDVKNKKHTTMKPALLQESNRTYWPFKPKTFKERIYQEVCLQKYYHYLQKKREVETILVGGTVDEEAFVDLEQLVGGVDEDESLGE